jgi:hypothetical protein
MSFDAVGEYLKWPWKKKIHEILFLLLFVFKLSSNLLVNMPYIE